jgi:hypothetical protein
MDYFVSADVLAADNSVCAASPLAVTERDREDAERILGPAMRAGRAPSDTEVAEFLMHCLRDLLAEGEVTIAALRKQFGGIDRERTIRKSAKALAWYYARIAITERHGGFAMRFPDGLAETFAALEEVAGEAES